MKKINYIFTVNDRTTEFMKDITSYEKTVEKLLRNKYQFSYYFPQILLKFVNENRVATHDGKYTLNDIFATALIALVCDIIREDGIKTLDVWCPKRLEKHQLKHYKGILFNAGKEHNIYNLRFDNHIKRQRIYDDKTPYGGFGILSLCLIPQIWGWMEYGEVDTIIKKIDALEDFQSKHNNWTKGETSDAQFIKASKFAYNVLDRLLKTAYENAENEIKKYRVI